MKRYPYIVLFSLVLLVLGPYSAYSQTEGRGHIAPGTELPEEFRGLTIKEAFVPSGAEPIGLIQTVIGTLAVFHGDNNTAYVAAAGDTLFKQDILFTLRNSRCRIKFSTNDVITMGEETRVGVEKYLDDPENGEKTSVISLLKGKAMFYVLRLFKYRRISTSVSTPTAIIGVRGTQFGTEVRAVGEMRAESQPVYLADASGSTSLSQAPPGAPKTETMVHCFDGAIDVFSPADGVTQSVEKGQSLQVTTLGAGEVSRTAPEAARQFISETEAPAPEDGGGEGSSETETPADSEKETGGDETTGEEASDETAATGGSEASAAADVTQNQTARAIEEKILSQGDEVGYLSAMLTRVRDGSNQFQHLYISDTRQDFKEGDTVQARDILGGESVNDPLLLIGGGGVEPELGPDAADPFLTSLDVNPGTGKETITGSFLIIDKGLGKNEYMEWGYWTQSQTMTSPSGDNYVIDNRGYFIYGRVTKDDELSTLASNNVRGQYRGSAHGTYWTADGGANMSGTFKADVDFAQKSISDFGVSVSGGGHTVTIGEASGTFSGNSSQFSIHPATPGSVWQIDGQDAHSKKREAYGSIYGPDGKKIGGVWKLDTPQGPGDAHATGMFEGSR